MGKQQTRSRVFEGAECGGIWRQGLRRELWAAEELHYPQQATDIYLVEMDNGRSERGGRETYLLTD